MEVDKFEYLTDREKFLGDLEIETRLRMWDFDIFQKAANILAAPSGAVAVGSETLQPQPSVIGGVLAGAAAGATTGNPWLIAGGAVLGGLGALLNR